MSDKLMFPTEKAPGVAETRPEIGCELIETLADDFLARRRRGETATASMYCEQHPEIADQIRDLFPVLLMMEDLKAAPRCGQPVVRGLPDSVERIGGYRIVGELGRGGMGVVYEAEQESLGRRVALKVLPLTMLDDETSIARFQHEAQAAAGLHHTNIVPVFEVGREGDCFYYAMQLIRGRGLETIIHDLRKTRTVSSDARGKSLPSQDTDPSPAETQRIPNPKTAPTERLRVSVDRGSDLRELSSRIESGAMLSTDRRYFRSVAQLGEQVASALAYAHERGVVHRDIKPSNLLLDDNGTIWLADFGLAKSGNTKLTQTGDVLGTLNYVSPERFRGEFDHRTDIYGLGLTLYEMLVLRPAFDAPDRLRLIDQINGSDPPRPRSVNRRIPQDLETIILKAIQKESKRRYTSCVELAADLRRFLEDRPIRARRTGVLESAWRLCRRNPGLAVSFAATAIMMIMVAIGLALGYTRESQLRHQSQLAARKSDHTAEIALTALDEVYETLVPKRAFENTLQDASRSTGKLPVPRPQATLSAEKVEVLKRLLDFYETLASQHTSDPQTWFRVARAIYRIGEIEQRLGRLDRAETYYNRALVRFALCGEPASEMARIYNDLGMLAGEKGDLPTAIGCHQKATNHLAKIERFNPEDVIACALSHYLVARTCVALHRQRLGRSLHPGFPSANDSARAGFPARSRRLVPPTRPGPTHQFSLSADELFDKRDDELKRATKLLEDMLVDEESNPTALFLLSLCYRENAKPRPGDTHSMEEREKAIRIQRRLIQRFPDEPDLCLELSRTVREVGVSNPPHLLDDLIESCKLVHQVVDKHPDISEYAVDLARGYAGLSVRLQATGQLELTEHYTDLAIQMHRTLLKRFPAVGEVFLPQLARIEWQLFSVRMDQRKWAAAKAAADDSLARLQLLRIEEIMLDRPQYDKLRDDILVAEQLVAEAASVPKKASRHARHP